MSHISSSFEGDKRVDRLVGYLAKNKSQAAKEEYLTFVSQTVNNIIRQDRKTIDLQSESKAQLGQRFIKFGTLKTMEADAFTAAAIQSGDENKSLNSVKLYKTAKKCFKRALSCFNGSNREATNRISEINTMLGIYQKRV